MSKRLEGEKGDIVILGVPFDSNSSFLRGAAIGWEALWSFINSGSSNWSSEDGIDISKVKKVKFLGKIKARDYFGIEDEIKEILKKNVKIISIGGDHSITLPILRAFSKFFRNIEIIHFDAHPDLYEKYEDNPYSHACAFARIMEEGLARKVTSIGVRASTPHQKHQAKKLGVEFIPLEDLHLIFKIKFENPVYLSIDIDSLDPAFAPGVSHPEPGGLSTRELLDIIKKVKIPSIIGADIVEFNPLRDINNITSAVVFKILKELISKFLQKSEN